MAEVITFKGTELWSTANGGAGWSFVAGSLAPQVIRSEAQLGVGVWRKVGNTAGATHRLELQRRTTDPEGWRRALEGLAGATAGVLVVPGRGSITCTLESCGEFSAFKTDVGYVVSTALTFVEDP